MKTFITTASLIAGASAAVLPREDGCCFHLTASGGQSGEVGQLSDGQNRIGGGHPAGTYCLSNGMITDGKGRGCILTPPTTQLQCDTGATPDSGFAVSANGELEHNSDSTFYACAAADNQYNIYTSVNENQTKCSKVTLSTGGECSGNGNGNGKGPSMPAMQSGGTATASKPASSPSAPKDTAHPTVEASTPSHYPPAPSAPAMSAPASAPSVSTSIVTQYVTVCDCREGSPAASDNAPPPKQSSMNVPAPPQSAPEGHMTKSAMETKPATGTMPAVETHPVPPQSAPSDQASKPAPSAGTATGTGTGSVSSCATSLVPGSYETPHLIVPINSQSPDTSYGTTYNAYANSQNSTVFNFDIPASYADKTCTLVFLFPEKKDLETTDYTFNGQGSLDFAKLSGAANEQTTYATCPSKAQDMESVTPQAGNSYVVHSGACAAGTTETVMMTATGGLELEFFEDWNPSPLGLFMTVC